MANWSYAVTDRRYVLRDVAAGKLPWYAAKLVFRAVLMPGLSRPLPGDPSEAARRRRAPRDAGFAAAVSALRARSLSWIALGLLKARRYASADALLEAARATHPRSRSLASTAGTAAQERGRHAEAVRHWNCARRLGASEPLAVARLASSLRHLGRLSEAQALVDSVVGRHPKNVRILTEAARLALHGNRPDAAADLWRRAMRRAKPHPDWLEGYAQSLIRLGDIETASAVVASARRRYPDDLGLLAAEGELATAKQDWTRAAALWTEYCRRAPDNAGAMQARGYALHGVGMSELTEEAVKTPVKADVTVLDDEPMRRLALKFESVGDDCELGLVQRRFGAEPLGLLRWNDVDLDSLIVALEQGFEGLGEPSNTAIHATPMGELFVTDRRWYLAMHTFLHVPRADPDDVYVKMCRRIVYLRDKFIEDLRTAEKIFVYRSATLDVAGLQRLHRALRAYGPVTLLGVQAVLPQATAGSGASIGDVVRLGEGLCIGVLPQSPKDALGNPIIDFEAWALLLGKVQQMMCVEPTSESAPQVAAA
ncbi:MAG: tetratricopeptide repeat protein [Beijerinckiaceae bacterium]|nr:tetratricopeptide repeat protein [Beijerinckiaceae bacterium]